MAYIGGNLDVDYLYSDLGSRSGAKTLPLDAEALANKACPGMILAQALPLDAEAPANIACPGVQDWLRCCRWVLRPRPTKHAPEYLSQRPVHVLHKVVTLSLAQAYTMGRSRRLQPSQVPGEGSARTGQQAQASACTRHCGCNLPKSLR